MDSLSSRRLLYQLMMSQLRADGFPIVASQLSQASMIPQPAEDAFPENYLFNLMGVGLANDGGSWDDIPSYKKTSLVTSLLSDISTPEKKKNIPGTTNLSTISLPQTGQIIKFSPDGQHLAVTLVDNQVRILDAERLRNPPVGVTEETLSKTATLRILTENRDPITDISFHPFIPMVATCSSDCSIRLFDYQKAFSKKSLLALTDTHSVNSIDFHPSGQYLLCGTNHNLVRLYDIKNAPYECYTSRERAQHTHGVNVVKFSKDGSMFATGSQNGVVRIWDAVSFTPIKTFNHSIRHQEIQSLEFSRNGKYLLSGGKDAIIKLWDVRKDQPLFSFSGFHIHRRTIGTFSGDESQVIATDASNSSIVMWHTNTGEYSHRIIGHRAAVLGISSSPTEPLLIASTAEDKSVRLWSSTEQNPSA